MADQNSEETVIHNFGLGGSHSRSLSQPTFFSSNCLPPLSPAPLSESSNSSLKDVSVEEVDVSSRGSPAYAPSFTRENTVFRGNESLPPRKGHRRATSDTVPLAFSAVIQSSPQLVPISGPGYSTDCGSVKEKPMFLQRKEINGKCDFMSNSEGMGEMKSDGEVIDEMFNSYMNLDRMDAWYSPLAERKIMDIICPATKASGESSNKGTEGVFSGDITSIHGTSSREGVKRGAVGNIAPSTRHFRSRSMDSAFGSLNLADEASKRQVALGIHVGQQHSPRNSALENPAAYNLEFGNGEFNEAELKKIILDERLTEVAISDPKRAKRILANRQSAARSKERKLRYISELEYKVQTVQSEATTLSAQLTVLQKDFTELTNQNNELKFRLQAMEQQAHLRDALHEALTAEVQRLKLIAIELREDGRLSNSFPQQNPMKHHMFPPQHEQSSQRNQLSVATSPTTTGSSTPTST